jgi:hypothetical protein
MKELKIPLQYPNFCGPNHAPIVDDLIHVTAQDMRFDAPPSHTVNVAYHVANVVQFDNRAVEDIENQVWGTSAPVAEGVLYLEFWRESEKGPVCERNVLYDAATPPSVATSPS